MGIVKDLGALDTYRFTGHSVIMGKQQAEWQNDDQILGMFAKTKKAARRKYRQFVEKGIDTGRRPEWVSGGLICSVGGWKYVFWAVRELGVTATELARQMGLTQPAISMSVNRGEGWSKKKSSVLMIFWLDLYIYGRPCTPLKVLGELSERTQVIFFRIIGIWWNWSKSAWLIQSSCNIPWVLNNRIER